MAGRKGPKPRIPSDAAGQHDHFKRLAKEKIAKARSLGFEPMVEAEDVAQAGLLSRLEMPARPEHAYRAMDEEISRSSSVSEAPLRIMTEVTEALERERHGLPPASLWQSEIRRKAEAKAQYRRSRLEEDEISAPVVRRLDPYAAELLEKAIGELPSFRGREILKLRYGLGDGHEYSLDEVSRIFKITRERARQVEISMVQKLAKILHGRLDFAQADDAFYEMNPDPSL